MHLNPILDTAISLVFIYLLFSILVSSLSELISQVRNKRGKHLKDALGEVFNDSTLNKDFTALMYSHPMIDRMKEKQTSLPSYLSAATFSQALVDVIGREYESNNVEFIKNEITGKYESKLKEGVETNVQSRFNRGLETMQYSDLKILLSQFSRNSPDAEALHKTIQTWFDDYMDRVSGWYKKNQQWKLFGLSFVVSVLMNVDTICISRHLWSDELLRSSLSSVATNEVNHHTASDSISYIKQMEFIDSLKKELKIPIGWDTSKNFKENLQSNAGLIDGKENGSNIYVSAIIGWILTALALRFGAPFWFDLLKRLVNIRGGGINPSEKPKAS